MIKIKCSPPNFSKDYKNILVVKRARFVNTHLEYAADLIVVYSTDNSAPYILKDRSGKFTDEFGPKLHTYKTLST